MIVFVVDLQMGNIWTMLSISQKNINRRMKIMMTMFVDLQMGNIWTILPASQTPLSGSPTTKHQQHRSRTGEAGNF